MFDFDSTILNEFQQDSGLFESPSVRFNSSQIKCSKTLHI